MNPERRCDTCKFFNPTRAGGNCHRFPPQAGGVVDGRFHFPRVDSSDWCGEWVRKLAEAVGEPNLRKTKRV